MRAGPAEASRRASRMRRWGRHAKEAYPGITGDAARKLWKNLHLCQPKRLIFDAFDMIDAVITALCDARKSGAPSVDAQRRSRGNAAMRASVGMARRTF